MGNFLIPLLFWVLCGLIAFVLEWHRVTKINHLEYITFNSISIVHIVCVILGPVFLLIVLICAFDDIIEHF